MTNEYHTLPEDSDIRAAFEAAFKTAKLDQRQYLIVFGSCFPAFRLGWICARQDIQDQEGNRNEA